ncbi:hypothetical protein LSPH24S_07202 [Lysinibacillus sphaericus]
MIRLIWTQRAMYITPKEHLGLPNREDVRVGVIDLLKLRHTRLT